MPPQFYVNIFQFLPFSYKEAMWHIPAATFFTILNPTQVKLCLGG